MKNRTCSNIEKQLPLLLHDELSKEGKHQVAEHLSGCRSCQNAYEKLHKTFELVRGFKREPEDFEAFNQALFRRIRESRPSQAFVLRPARWGVRPAILVPVVSICLLLLAIGFWQHSQGSLKLAKAEVSLEELSVLETLEEGVPEVEGELLEEEILSQDEMLLVEAIEPPQGEAELLKELELLEQLEEGEDIREGTGDLEEELLLTDEEMVG